MSDVQRVVVLLSGGVDSTVAAYWYADRGAELVALSFDYGQRHQRELQAARSVSTALGIRQHLVIPIRLDAWQREALGGGVSLALDRTDEERESGVSPTYLPGRNTIFISFGLSMAEMTGSQGVLIGATRGDHAGYPDCREEYFTAWDEVAARAGTNPMRVLRPFVCWKKQWVVEAGRDLGVDFGLTWSCYAGGGQACGRCDACLVRKHAFRDARINDPIPCEG